MGISKVKQAQRARRIREQSNTTLETISAAGVHRPVRSRRRTHISLLDADITDPLPRCTVRWADNTTSEIPLTKLLKPSIWHTISGLQHIEASNSRPTAQAVQPRPASTALADLRQANEARARLEAELEESKSRNLAPVTQNEMLKESSDQDACAVKLLKTRARKDILTIAKLKTQVHQLRTQMQSLDAERKALKVDLARVSNAVVSWGFQDVDAIPII
ncbi:hypothetical protein M409DRAFT_30547 [Zasmidium cellare ATCC 36951]|uniref:Uncharacterized protein n=1 Tax=Zasmidium cellare ATCC 36951 TaxID=1080233 RepID=A0A6A6BZK0_ZASCE|nr:uncharacterized protein M409DRAFT_30547 [Zasmidium cellare ATCC 36951]KAF2159012.1 hypothetical protein M409DRAFT_30547 [Zasmidium cellare ATCC 36951]